MVHLGGVYATSTLLAPQLLNPLGEHVVALPVACGEMAFRGDALEPVFPQRGPWAVRLELKGAGAVERPLAFVATVKSCVEINQCVGCAR